MADEKTLNEYLIRQLTGLHNTLRMTAKYANTLIEEMLYANMLTEEMLNCINSADSADSADAPAPAEPRPEIKPHARILTEEERKALGEVRAACVRKAAAEGTKEILLFLQAHGVRSIFDLDSKFYPDLLKICDVKEDC